MQWTFFKTFNNSNICTALSICTYKARQRKLAALDFARFLRNGLEFTFCPFIPFFYLHLCAKWTWCLKQWRGHTLLTRLRVHNVCTGNLLLCKNCTSIPNVINKASGTVNVQFVYLAQAFSLVVIETHQINALALGYEGIILSSVLMVIIGNISNMSLIILA